MTAPKRRLPVLKSTPAEEEGDPPRPAWQWVLFGVLAIFGAWVPMQYLAEAVAQRVTRAFIGEPQSIDEVARALDALSSGDRTRMTIALVGVRMTPAVLATLAGGYLVGRWGAEKVGPRQAAAAGAIAAAIVSAVAVLSAPTSPWVPLVLVAVMTPIAALGGRIGLKKRVADLTPNVR